MDLKSPKKVTKTMKVRTSTPKKISVYDFDSRIPSIFAASTSNPGLPKTKGKKSSILSMICEAIKTVGIPIKGASYITIQKWIINNRKNSQPKRLKTLIKKSIAKGLEVGLLKRTAFSKTAVGLQGYFIVNRKYCSKNSTHINSKNEVLNLKEVNKKG